MTDRHVAVGLSESWAGVQRRTVRTLMASQAMGAVGNTIGIATASLLAEDISGSERQAGLAQTFQVLGAAIAAYLLARLMAQRGRRIGLSLGYLLGALGGVTCVLAGVVESMPLLLLGAVFLGATSAANSQARYAATDLAAPDQHARALSLVVWATTVGAVVGPNLTGPAGSLAQSLDIPELTGPFALGSIGMVLASVILFVFLRPDPLLLSRTDLVVSGTSWARVRAALRERPVLPAAIAGLAGAHAVMVGVMVMTPIHMRHGGAEIKIIGVVISVHVLGMFAFSPLVGMLADRIGRVATLGIGGMTLILATALSGCSPDGMSWQVLIGLFLLGLGWSFAMVAASSLVSEHAPADARTDVQGMTDLVMGISAAAAGGVAGLIVGSLGYAWLNVFAGALSFVVLAAASVARAVSAET